MFYNKLCKIKKVKNTYFDNILTDLKKYLEELERKLYLLEENTDKFLRHHDLILSKEDLQLTKMKALESDIKKQMIISEKIEEENNLICN